MNSLCLKLDPWSASSLLQKAIRRGEEELALAAAATLYRQRGNAIWRRLMIIAFEDVGIAAPDLVAEVSKFGTDKNLRSVIGEDSAIVCDLTKRLAGAPKDRSADYLYCASVKLPECQQQRDTLRRLGTERCVAIACDPDEPLLRRAVATLSCCTVDGHGIETVPKGTISRIASEMDVLSPSQLHQATALAASKRCHPIVLMAPLLWSAYTRDRAPTSMVSDSLPVAEFAEGVPLYTYDMHTWAGKRAIARLARENREVRTTLANYVQVGDAAKVANVAAFYADASPIRGRFDWGQSRALETIGKQADLMHEGCAQAGVGPVLECVRRTLDHLNKCRREIVSRRNSK